jgi:hypothetical protein
MFERQLALVTAPGRFVEHRCGAHSDSAAQPSRFLRGAVRCLRDRFLFLERFTKSEQALDVADLHGLR